MLEHPIITLTTDFGLKDPFVGMMKGVILEINPEVRIVDITHNIQQHNILEASQKLLMSYKYFPSSTIHIAVVDPGVGSSRRPILFTADNNFFIGPDNGIFSSIMNEADPDSVSVVHITAEHYFLSTKGATFHGRDIFAPVGAWLSKGVDSSKFGEPIYDYTKIPVPGVTFSDNNSLTGEIVSIDNFGNAISNITKSDLNSLDTSGAGKFRVIYNNAPLTLVSFYAESKGPVLSAIINSSDRLELFVNERNAADTYNIKTGDKVQAALI
jgi:S-adenosylmethionine hydrolase